jgi:hypothetical protein
MICVNMQTSFMHPPFGFALFYLRGIADTLFKNGSLPRKVLSSDIYLGAIPWVAMQLILVAIVIAFPQTVTAFLDKEKVVDMNKAGDMLQNMGGGRSDRSGETGPGLPPSTGASAPAGQASAPLEGSSNDDAMEAVRRAVREDAAGKK